MDWHLTRPVAIALPPSVHSPSPPASPSYAASPGPLAAKMLPPPPPMGITKAMTMSSRSLSFGSLSSHHKAIKYGSGRHAGVELIPQPSDDPHDPLNWPRWKKDLNLLSLLVSVGLVGGMKTAFITTAGVMAARFHVSYTAVAALTAVPVLLSALAGLASCVAAKLWGKRPLYLASALLLLAGAACNATPAAADSYAACMGGRVLQGLGWGAFDTLVMGSIQDTYFEHERNLPVSLYNVFSIATTWGSPLLGGVASSNAGSFTAQFHVISGFQALAIPLLVLAAPETAFDRAAAVLAMPPVPGLAGLPPPRRPWRLRHRLNRDAARRYLRGMAPLSFGGPMTTATALQAPRALVAPTTCLLAAVSLVPHGSLWGFATSLAMLTTPPPLALGPALIGTLMTGPWILATAVVGGFCFYRGFHQKFTHRVSYTVIASGSFVVLVGLLSFGLGVHNFMTPPPAEPSSSSSSPPPVFFFFTPAAARLLSLPLLSFQLGVLAAGLHVLDTTTRPLLARSASFTASSIAVAHRSIGDMHAGVVVVRALAAALCIVAAPAALARVPGLKAAAIALAAAQVLVAAAVVALWCRFHEAIWRADGRVMGLVDLRLLKESVSFFDHD